MQNEITNLIKVIIYQNYFKINNTIWQQTIGTQIGSPIPSTLAEMYPNLIKEDMSSTLPHVDTVLIVYNADHTTAEAILYNHKNMHPKMTM
jgi:hypothetical protein